MSDDSQRPIIVKRIKKAAHGHHGGAWKIAYADFVTAMMAFFLLMWLLGSTTKAQREGIAEFFKAPLKISMRGGTGAGDASSVIKGGGTDLSRKEGQRQKTNEPDRKKITDPKAAKAEEARLEKERLEKLKAKLEEKIETNLFLKQFKKQLIIDITSEGLRIQIVDEKNRPMFASGSAVMQPYAREILSEIAKVLNEVPNTISLSGHTDAVAYSGGERGYSNWELSADRANASRRELVSGGIEEGKLLRVVGLSSAVPFDKEDHNNPINRRISIIVMNKETEEAVRSDGKKLDVPVEALKEAAGAGAGPLKP
jgi:chemotaxis protein MotB